MPAAKKAKKTRKPYRKSNRVTLQDISDECKVSKATVCRVLNGKLNDFPVSQEMVERVKETAARLGYRPNRLAQAVRSSRTWLVGLSYYHIDCRVRSSLQVTQDSQQLGRYVTLIHSQPGFDRYDLVMHARRENAAEPFHLSDFKTDLLEGMIYIMPTDQHLEFLDVASADFPIVLMGYTPAAVEKMPCVDINNRKAMRKAVEYLIQTGRRRILLVVPDLLRHVHCIVERVQGFRDVHERNAMPLGPEKILYAEIDPATMQRQLEERVRAMNADAVLFCTDQFVGDALARLKEMGKDVPNEVALMTFVSNATTRDMVPAITSLEWSVEQMVDVTVSTMLKILSKEIPYEPGMLEIGVEIAERGSTPRTPGDAAASDAVS